MKAGSYQRKQTGPCRMRPMRRTPLVRPAVAAVLSGALAALSCSNNSSGDTINVNGLDCGLVRADMVGTWTVTFAGGVRTLQNCTPLAPNGTPFSVTSATVNYTVPDAGPSDEGAEFVAQGRSGSINGNDLKVSIEASSCLAIVRTWETDDDGWAVCLGTADRANRLINAVCDSVELDPNLDGTIDARCDLNSSLTAAVGLP